MKQSESLYLLHVPALQQEPFEAAITDGYISYCQALELGLQPTPDYLYTFILTRIRDVHHSDHLNTGYITGWLAAHYENEKSYGSIEHHTLLASSHLALVRQQLERLDHEKDKTERA